MIIAVIPARGGSKRIPRKNIKLFCDKPIIGWSIEAAQASGCFDSIIVSTDDPEIASVARQFGVEVPFERPAALADDFASTTAVMRHAVQWHIENRGDISLACCLYAMAPFVTPADLKRGQSILTESDAEYALTVTSYGSPIQRAVRLNSNNRLQMFNPEEYGSRSQDLEVAYHDAGQFYWGRKCAWVQEKPIFADIAAAIIMPRFRVQDIDSPEDWIRAEMMFAIQRGTIWLDT